MASTDEYQMAKWKIEEAREQSNLIKQVYNSSIQPNRESELTELISKQFEYWKKVKIISGWAAIEKRVSQVVTKITCSELSM